MMTFSDGCEIGDVCENRRASVQMGQWRVQPYWSNFDQNCVPGVSYTSLRQFMKSRSSLPLPLRSVREICNHAPNISLRSLMGIIILEP